MKKFALLSLAALPLFAVADTVQHEVEAGYTHYDGSDFSADASAISYSYYFQAMETAGAIKHELPFMRRSDYVRGMLQEVEGSTSGHIEGRYFTYENAFIGAGYSSDGDGDNAVSIHGGRYFEENGAYQITLSHDFDTHDTGADAGIRRISTIGHGAGLAYGAGLGAYALEDVSDTFFVRADATYYFSEFTGAGVELTHVDDSDFTAYQFLFSHYFNERLGVILAAGEHWERVENVTFSVKGRF